MRLDDFLSDRLGQLVFWSFCAGAAAVFLLLTGTQPGVIVILLLAALLIVSVG